MGMKDAMDIRAGHVLKIDGAACKVISHEIRGTGKFGKTIHLRLKRLTDSHLLEKSVKAEERVEDVETRHVKLQYLYRDGDRFMFMNNETYEEVALPAQAIGKQETFLKENTEVDAIYSGDKPITLEFPKTVELRVVRTAPGVKGQADTTYKEAELENGLKILVPQFIKEEEVVRVNTDDLSYIDRVTVKSLKTGGEFKEKEKEKEKGKES
ncbi:MAG: elongation factor P [Candidatus Omnitrophica bacterium]|nr:elongation factor P [Candidatus Omnitrophota bacterium]